MPKRIEIYQLKSGPELRFVRFTDYRTLQEEKFQVEAKNYDNVYSCERPEDYDLEDVYYEFNAARPDDFKGHSLSVSDIVVVMENEKKTAWYVDTFGYQEVPEFLQ